MVESDIKKGQRVSFIVGVDSGQAGIFCDSIYPITSDIGEYEDVGSFYGACCNATCGAGYSSKGQLFSLKQEMGILKDYLKNRPDDKYSKLRLETIKEKIAKHVDIPWIKAGLVFGKGVVSCSGYGDGSYRCYVYKKNEKVIGIRIFFI
jgi:hypothetical protein